MPDEESCGTFGDGCCEGEEAEEEQVFGDRQRNSGLLMAMAFCEKKAPKFMLLQIKRC